jgi:hypothetical protein
MRLSVGRGGSLEELKDENEYDTVVDAKFYIYSDGDPGDGLQSADFGKGRAV